MHGNEDTTKRILTKQFVLIFELFHLLFSSQYSEKKKIFRGKCGVVEVIKCGGNIFVDTTLSNNYSTALAPLITQLMNQVLL